MYVCQGDSPEEAEKPYRQEPIYVPSVGASFAASFKRKVGFSQAREVVVSKNNRKNTTKTQKG